MFVYFIRVGKKGAIKIGKAKDVEQRRDQLQIGNPKLLHIIAKVLCDSNKAAYETEKAFHKLFSNQYLRGEWYNRKINIAKILNLC